MGIKIPGYATNKDYEEAQRRKKRENKANPTKNKSKLSGIRNAASPQAMMGGGKVKYAAGGMKMDPEYKSAGGMVYKGR